jgi:ankyrin repeat protein
MSDIIRILLDHDADVNTQGGEDGTNLQAAASQGHIEIVQLLLDHGADVNAYGGKYGTGCLPALYFSEIIL